MLFQAVQQPRSIAGAAPVAANRYCVRYLSAELFVPAPIAAIVPAPRAVCPRSRGSLLPAPCRMGWSCFGSWACSSQSLLNVSNSLVFLGNRWPGRMAGSARLCGRDAREPRGPNDRCRWGSLKDLAVCLALPGCRRFNVQRCCDAATSDGSSRSHCNEAAARRLGPPAYERATQTEIYDTSSPDHAVAFSRDLLHLSSCGPPYT
jgi:hypothetical protein